MKVVQINILGATLSTGRNTREMQDYFKEHGIESYIVCPASLDCDDAFFFSSRNWMRFATLMKMVTGLEESHSSIQTRKLLKYLDQIKPDVVHIGVIHANCMNIYMLLKYLAKNDIATVITLHDFWFLTGKCCYFTNLKCDRWITGCHHCVLPQNKKRPVLFDRSKKMWEDKKRCLQAIPRLAFIGVSDWVVSEAKKSPMCQGKILRRIYNWMDLTVFYPRSADNLRKQYNCEGKFVILGVSAWWNIGDRKGFDVYLDLAKSLPDSYVIMLVGQMNYSGVLPSNIISVGSISDKEKLAEFYSCADVYLNLSTEETFGKVSAEALSCGTPVVAIKATANTELVSEQCGVLVENMDCGEISQALECVREKGKKYYSESCRKFAEINFDLNRNIGEHVSLYEEMMFELQR